MCILYVLLEAHVSNSSVGTFVNTSTLALEYVNGNVRVPSYYTVDLNFYRNNSVGNLVTLIMISLF